MKTFHIYTNQGHHGAYEAETLQEAAVKLAEDWEVLETHPTPLDELRLLFSGFFADENASEISDLTSQSFTVRDDRKANWVNYYVTNV